MKTPCLLIAVVLMTLDHNLLLAADGPAAAEQQFYAQACFYGQPDPRYRTADEKMKLLRDLGYAGYSQFFFDGLPEIQKAIDGNHLKLFHVYSSVSVDPKAKQKYDPKLKEVIALLKGRETMIGLLLGGKPPSTPQWDPQAVAVVREIADLAAAANLRVVLYPHQAMWVERVQDAVRVAQKTERKNVGVVFSEVHFFLVDEEKNLDATLKSAQPYLYAVNINGHDGDQFRQRERVLQTLDKGSFDNLKLLKRLRQIGYNGPIGLHCYSIPGDVRDNLARSIAAWKKLSVLSIK